MIATIGKFSVLEHNIKSGCPLRMEATMHQGSVWITQERLRIYGQAIFLAELLGILLQLVFRWLYPDLRSIIVPASDFRVFWAASQLALQGDPIGAYDLDKIFTTIQASDPSITEKYPWFGWFYPPTFLLAILPLALLSCSQAFVLFVGSSLAAYVALLSRIARPFPYTVAYPCIRTGDTCGL
jgi:hypothetical protein